MPSKIFEGDEIEIQTKGGSFRGYIHNLNAQMLILKNVVSVNNNVKFPGLKCFTKDEIISSKVLKSPPPSEVANPQAIDDPTTPTEELKSSDESSDLYTEEVASPENVQTPVTPQQLTRIDELKRSIEEFKSSLEPMFNGNTIERNDTPLSGCSVDQKDADCIEKKKGPIVDKSHYKLNYVVIDKLGDHFRDSIAALKLFKTLGVAFIGSGVDQGKDFSWVALHSKDVYLYDILSLGKSAFQEGLKEVFEDRDIVKLVFDCRLPSHILLHKYNSLLTNVLDLKVLNTFVDSFVSSGQKIQKCFNSLMECSIGCHDLPVTEISSQAYRLEKAKKNKNYWTFRPVNGDDDDDEYSEMLQTVIFEAIHLKDLKESLVQKMMEPAIDGTDIFLGLYRDARNVDISRSDSNLVPKEFQDRSVMRHMAEASRKKTEGMLNGRRPSSAGGAAGKSTHEASVQNRVERSSDKQIATEESSDTSSKTMGRQLLSKLMEEARKERSPVVSVAPCGSESGYILDQKKQIRSNGSQASRNKNGWTGEMQNGQDVERGSDFRLKRLHNGHHS